MSSDSEIDVQKSKNKKKSLRQPLDKATINTIASKKTSEQKQAVIEKIIADQDPKNIQHLDKNIIEKVVSKEQKKQEHDKVKKIITKKRNKLRSSKEEQSAFLYNEV